MLWPAYQAAPTKEVHPRAVIYRARKCVQPVWIYLDIVIGEDQPVTFKYPERAIPGSRQAEPRFKQVAQGQALDKLVNDRGCAVGARIVDYDELELHVAFVGRAHEAA